MDSLAGDPLLSRVSSTSTEYIPGGYIFTSVYRDALPAQHASAEVRLYTRARVLLD